MSRLTDAGRDIAQRLLIEDIERENARIAAAMVRHPAPCRKYNHCACCAKPFQAGDAKYIVWYTLVEWPGRDGSIQQRAVKLPRCAGCLPGDSPDWLYQERNTCPVCGCRVFIYGGQRVTWKRLHAVCSKGCANKRFRDERRAHVARHCSQCAAEFTPLRADAHHCSAACKQRAYRGRKRAANGGPRPEKATA